MELAVHTHAPSHVTHTDVEIHHDSGLKTRGYPGTGGVGGRECKVEKSGTRVSQAWPERQDQILRIIVDLYRGKTVP